jgi:tRNA threonylcarbamoyladenosine biosynthesis protein TsaB
MMKLLALDAATEACSVAIKLDNNVLDYFEVCSQQHSQKLLPAVDQLLAKANIKLTDLDGIIYGKGPGSFTGVRIGVAITQGLAFGANLPVLGVSNLALMAQQAIDDLGVSQVICAIDARMSEVYFAVYENKDGKATEVISDRVCKPEALAELDLNLADDAVAVGTGWQTYESELLSYFNCKLTDIYLPNVKYAFNLVQDGFANGDSLDAELAQPSYVRDEVTWKKLPGR